MGNNVESASDHLPYLNGREVEEYIKEHAYANHVVKTKMCVKFVL